MVVMKLSSGGGSESPWFGERQAALLHYLSCELCRCRRGGSV